MKLLDNAFAMMFMSFIAGLIADPLLRRLPAYQWLSTRYLFASSRTYELLGVLWFRWFLLITPLRWFNTKIAFTQNRDLATLKSVRDHIATAEVSHWVGFVCMLVATVVAWWLRGSTVGLAYVFFNVLGNLYPCLLQQYNKRRLAQVIALFEKREASRRIDSVQSTRVSAAEASQA